MRIMFEKLYGIYLGGTTRMCFVQFLEHDPYDMYIGMHYCNIRDFLRDFYTTKYYNKHVLKRSHRVWLFIQYQIQEELESSIPTKRAATEFFIMYFVKVL